MKFLIVLAIIALASPLFAQEYEEKQVEKRGISLGLSSGGLGYGGHGIISHSAPILRVSSVGHGLGGYSGGYSGGLSGHGRISSHY